MKKKIEVLKNGIVKENPVFILLLGTCPTLAVTTSTKNGIGMGLSTLAVLLGSNIVISLTRKYIPEKVRIPAFITIIAGFVTLVQMLLEAYIPSLDKSLGIFIPLIVVNCIILARAEIFASKNKVLLSIMDALGMGIGFTLALTILGTVREILGAGQIFGITIIENISPALIMILPPGGFLAYGIIAGIIGWITKRKQNKCIGCPINCKNIEEVG